MKKEIQILGVALMATLGAWAQPGTVIFHDDFGTGVRKISPYVATGINAFEYANPVMEYALTGSGLPPAGVWTSNADYWKHTAKAIENNHYAVVAPSRFYEGTGITYSTFPFSEYGFRWETLANGTIRGVDPGSNALGAYVAGDADNAVMAVNAGTTPGILYQRPVQLERGKYYKLTYWLFVETAPVRLKTNMLNADGSVGLGTALGEPNGGAGTGWKLQTQYFYLPPAVCTENTYTINLQNHNLADGGNDFAIDEVLLVEVSGSEVPTGANQVEALCPETTAIPVANDDTEHFDVSTSTQRVFLFANDDKSDGSDIYVPSTNYGSHLPQVTRFKPEFLVPAGEGHSVTSATIDGQNIDGAAPTLTIQGEGTWAIKADWIGGEQHYYVEFKPDPTFKGNPSPIQYTVKEYADATARANDNGLTSAPATVTITFDNDSNPVATDDYQLNPNDGTNFKINIFTHGNDKDNIDGIETNGTGNSGSFEIEAVHPKNEGAVYSSIDGSGIPSFVVPGEGTWTYNAPTREFTFVPEAGFGGEASALPYRFKDPATEVWSNWAYVYVGSTSPVPVTLESFSVTAMSTSSVLNWNTVSENNNKGFAVEHSVDGQNWKSIGFVNSLSVNGNSNNKLAYNFIDNAPKSGANYYRLAQTDFSGKVANSDVRKVTFTTQDVVTVYPNPAQQNVNILFNANNQYTLKLTSVNGNVVLSENVNVTKGFVHSISRKQLAAGTYIVTLVDANGVTASYQLIFN